MRFISLVAAVAFLTVLVSPSAGGAIVYAQGTLSPPTAVAAVDGSNPGEVNLSWSPVPDADYYRIGWVDYEDLQAATDAGLEWLEAFVFVDVVNSGQTSYTVTRLKPGAYYAFIVGITEARFGPAQWSEWATLTLQSAPTTSMPSTGQIAAGSTILIIPPPPSSDCYVGLQLPPGHTCNWPHPERANSTKADMSVIDGGDYHGRMATFWDKGSMWVTAADKGDLNYTTGGSSSGTRYRFKAERMSGDVWVITAVNEPYQRELCPAQS